MKRIITVLAMAIALVIIPQTVMSVDYSTPPGTETEAQRILREQAEVDRQLAELRQVRLREQDAEMARLREENRKLEIFKKHMPPGGYSLYSGFISFYSGIRNSIFSPWFTPYNLDSAEYNRQMRLYGRYIPAPYMRGP